MLAWQVSHSVRTPLSPLFHSLLQPFLLAPEPSLSSLSFGPSPNSSHFVSSSLCPFYAREPISTDSPVKLREVEGKRWRKRESREGDRQKGDFRGCLLLWRPSGTKRWAMGYPAMVCDTVIQNVCTSCI